MTISALSVHLKLNLKEVLAKIESQYAAVNLCKEFGMQQQQYLMVVGFIPQTTESSGIL